MNEMRNQACEDVKDALPALAGERGMTLAMRRHISRCRGCAQELETYRALRATTAQLAGVTAAPPPGLWDALVSIPAGASRFDEVRSHLTRHRRAYASGVAVALGATGAVLWRARRRSLATA